MPKKIIYDLSTDKITQRDFNEDEQKNREEELKNKPTLDLQQLRLERNNLLYETDWWASSDLTMTDAQKKYRQDLRDITKTFQSMEDKDFKFPDKPKG